jgi:hypothetical protein
MIFREGFCVFLRCYSCEFKKNRKGAVFFHPLQQGDAVQRCKARVRIVVTAAMKIFKGKQNAEDENI